MRRARSRATLLRGATERVVKRHPNGLKAFARYYRGRTYLGYRSWYESGQMEYEMPVRPRGPSVVRMWHPGGQLAAYSPYLDGQEHGVSRQWDRRGKLICSYRMRRGTGFEYWNVIIDGRRSSMWWERHRVNGGLHGVERSWSGRWLIEEIEWDQGRRHGVWIRWDTKGHLERGYPKYFLRDREVPKRRYLRAMGVVVG